MDFNQNTPDKSESVASSAEEQASGGTLSIDEFFRQLEAREKDLHITVADTVIEIDDSDAASEDDDIPEFLKRDLAAVPAAAAPPKANGYGAPKNPQTSASTLQLENKIASLQNQAASLQNQVARLEGERSEMYELARRRQTDFDNFKKRIERDRADTFRSQLGNLAKQMLPVLDNLNRALDAASDCGAGENAQNFEQFFEGIMLVNQQLGEVLEEMGVQPIAAVGEPFDPHFHEAVAAEKADEGTPPNTVTAELLRGYRIDDLVIRASMVKVSK